MRTVHVGLPNNAYDIHIDRGIISRLADYINVEKETVVITDDGVPKQYLDIVMSQLNNAKSYIVPEGETSKSMKRYEEVMEWMIQNRCTRATQAIALGGGVIGDLVGFISSTYMRGISFVQIPTTLLSQIDSSVGGKTGINASTMKNAFGAFYQPKAVLIDPDTLDTLEANQYAAGMAEMIKYAMIRDNDLFVSLEEATDHAKIEEWIETCVSIKRDVVLVDERDTGIRQILNYGHTIGHAIEAEEHFGLLHGECVAIGMKCMAKPYPFYNRFCALLEKYHLNIDYKVDAEVLFPYITTDKKVQSGTLTVILVEEIGQAILKEIPVAQIKDYMEVN